MRESEIEKKLVALVQARGGLARKFTSPNQKGVPDRIVIWYGGEIHFIEVKRSDGKLTGLQKLEQEKLETRGCTVLTLYGIAGVKEYITAIDGLFFKKAS